MSLLVGINAFHGDASAAAVQDGRVLAAVAEERFSRRKHQAGFPAQALRWVVQEAAGGDWSRVSALAVARKPRAHLWKKVAHVLRHPHTLGRALGRWRNLKAVEGLRGRLERELGLPAGSAPRLVAVEHHLAHLASTFYASPFEEAACLTVDGFGDFVSSMSAHGRGTRLEVLRTHCWPHSLGLYYTAITQWLGFPHYGDEYKVMGLAAYGEPTAVGALEQVLHVGPQGRFELELPFFRHVSDGIEMSWDAGEPVLGDVFTPRLEQLLGPRRRPDEPLTQRHKDLAASCQALYERALVGLVQQVLAQTGSKRLCLAGGCGQNSLANGRLYEATGLSELYVQPAAGDDGTALGAALYVAHALEGTARGPAMASAALGPGYSEAEVAAALAEALPQVPLDGAWHGEFCAEQVLRVARLCSDTAKALADGEVVGWYQGRSEWGPRALGQRSILADPRRPDARELLNVRIKRRESFRPFAPSVLKEHVEAWFVGARPDPFMTQVFPVHPQRRDAVPAIVHADGTGRVQAVDRAVHPLYASLIDAFHALTGVPMLLNTSFNESEPIVNTPREAIDCFLRTRMDRLVMGTRVLTRPGAGHE